MNIVKENRHGMKIVIGYMTNEQGNTGYKGSAGLTHIASIQALLNIFQKYILTSPALGGGLHGGENSLDNWVIFLILIICINEHKGV